MARRRAQILGMLTDTIILAHRRTLFWHVNGDHLLWHVDGNFFCMWTETILFGMSTGTTLLACRRSFWHVDASYPPKVAHAQRSSSSTDASARVEFDISLLQKMAMFRLWISHSQNILMLIHATGRMVDLRLHLRKQGGPENPKARRRTARLF